MSNGKGSDPRPLSVTRLEFSNRWDQTFKLREASELDQEPTAPGDAVTDAICELPEPQRARD